MHASKGYAFLAAKVYLPMGKVFRVFPPSINRIVGVLTFERLLEAARIRRLIRDDLIQVSGRELEGTKAARRRERFSKVVSVASRPLADM